MSRRSLLAVALCFAASPACAEVPAHLKGVPPDAAVFVHVAVGRLWAGPVGEQLRAAGIPEYDRVLKEFTGLTGLTPADITAMSVTLPDLRSPQGGEFTSFAAAFTLAKPLDVGRIEALAVVAGRALEREFTVRFDKGVVTVTIPEGTNRRPNPAVASFVATADLRDPLHPTVVVALSKDGKLKTLDSGTTPQAAALAAAATHDLVVGVNFDGLPPEFRQDELFDRQPEMRPFVPIVKSQAAMLTGRFADEKLTLELRIRSDDAAVRANAEKSLGALRTVLAAAAEGGATQFGRSNDPGAKEVAALMTQVQKLVNAAPIRVDGTDAVATLTLPADLPVASAIAATMKRTLQSASNRAVAQNNLKQLGLAMHNYESANATLPPAFTVGKKGKPLLSWRVAVLPYVEQDALYRQFKLDEPWDSEHNLKVLKDNPMPKVFGLPGVTKDTDKETHYRVFVGNGAAFEKYRPQKFFDFTDGSSNTLLIATAATAVPWTKPEELDFDPKGDVKKLLKLGGDDGGCSVLFCDGSVRFLNAMIAGDTLKALVTRSGGEVVNIE